MNWIKEIWKGKDLYRLLLNKECANHAIAGRVLDVGSGQRKASYHRFLKQAHGTIVELLDQAFTKEEGEKGLCLDLEKDPLPYTDAEVDVILAFNVLEHMYQYDHLLQEFHRVLKTDGMVLGVVPFLVGYHPDPHDYWRYTHETLHILFLRYGFSRIRIVPLARGPFSAGYAQMEVCLPRLFKICLLPCLLFLDACFVRLSRDFRREHYALGFFFSCQKEIKHV